MQVVILPPLQLVEGQPFEGYWRWQDQATGLPVDFTEVIDGVGWTGRVTIAVDLDSAPIIDIEPDLNASGEITFTLTGSQFASLTPPAQIGGGVVGVFQILLTSPVPALTQIWQGPVTLAGVL